MIKHLLHQSVNLKEYTAVNVLPQIQLTLTVAMSLAQVQNTDELTFAFCIEGKELRLQIIQIYIFLRYEFKDHPSTSFIPRDPL